MMFRLLFAALLSGLTLAAHAQLTILQYHHVDTTTPASTSISPDDFRRHLALLEQEGMVVMDLAAAMKALRAGENLPAKAVAITFDDAYLSIYQNAFPLLKARHWPFTIFVNTAAVDGGHGPVLSWDQLREMRDAGALIANHTVHHPYLIEQPEGLSLDDWMKAEVEAAETRLVAELGSSPRMLAYPYGEFSLAIAGWLRDHNYLAFGQQSGPVGPLSHPQALPRFPAAGVYANTETLKTKLYTLALPLNPEEVNDPVLNDATLPQLVLHFPVVDLNPAQFQCFASSEGAIPTEASTSKGMITLITGATQPMKGGRSRYNCTAPSRTHKGWYYWYSQLWINQTVNQR
ncbi:polysaccharide deacetylase family protein [Thalassolituus sp. LLYu03]|uniref:polysaccharide deacetylase family protein n=1 Tax=Thalassolituus sp. LLYu03 TaxID=3421656 RepID=UPI003D2BFA21